MDLTRQLTEGVGAWLHFEYCCNRSGLFNENYLSVAVGQILSASYGDRVHGDFEHPILAPLMQGPGRRPALDFVYCDPYPMIKVAVETKWAGSTHATPENIIWDMIRLELVANHYGAECIFLIAGQRNQLNRLFRSQDFSGPSHIPERTSILSANHNNLTKLSLLPDKHYRNALLKKVFERCQHIPIPHSIISRRAKPFPFECTNNQFQVFAWRISPALKRGEFTPANNHYFAMQQPA